MQEIKLFYWQIHFSNLHSQTVIDWLIDGYFIHPYKGNDYLCCERAVLSNVFFAKHFHMFIYSWFFFNYSNK